MPMLTCDNCGLDFQTKRAKRTCAACRESAAIRRTGQRYDFDPATRAFGHNPDSRELGHNDGGRERFRRVNLVDTE